MNETLATLISIENELREQKTLAELAFFIAHQTNLLFPYKRGIVFTCYQNQFINIESISGIVELDKQSPYQQTLQKLIKGLIAKENGFEKETIYRYQMQELASTLDLNLNSSFNQMMIVYPFFHEEALIGGVMLLLDTLPDNEKKHNQLEFLLKSYNYSFGFISQRKKRFAHNFYLPTKKRMFSTGVALFVLAVMCIRVPLTVMADAEVTPKDPEIITAPMDGAIDAVAVHSAQEVKQGELLFSMEKRDLNNAYHQALSELSVVKEKLNKAIQSSFKDIKTRSEINILKAEIAEKQLQVDYSHYLLKESDIYAPHRGIAIITSPETWSGKPVKIGEKVLELANKDNVQVNIWLPLSDALYFTKGDEVSLFLNADPLTPLKAHVAYSSFGAEKSPKDLLAYKVTAYLEAGQPIPRIGSQGSAKLYHGKASLFYYLFRRPLTYLRQTLGF